MVDPSPAAAAASPAASPLDARHERRVERLARIADVCVRLAERTEQQAIEANWLGVDGPKMIMLIARAARQTTALEARLDREFEARAERRAADAARGAALARERARRVKDKVRRAVETMIEARAEDDPRRTERLYDDLRERLDDPSVEAGFGDRTIAEIVAGICADIGIAMDDAPLWENAEADYVVPDRGATGSSLPAGDGVEGLASPITTAEKPGRDPPDS